VIHCIHRYSYKSFGILISLLGSLPINKFVYSTIYNKITENFLYKSITI